MLTKHSVLLNKIRNEKYKRCKFRCNNLEEFEEPFRPSKVVAINELVQCLALEGVERECEYYSYSLVGRYSPYRDKYKGDECDLVPFGENDFMGCDSELLYSYFSDLFEPVQLELPYDTL